MSIENTPVESTDVDLDAFASELFGQSTQKESAQEEEANPSDEEAEDQDDSDATETDEDTNSEDDDTLDTETDDDEEDEPKPEVKEKPKKNRFQERIDELTAKARVAEREKDELRAKLDEVIARLDNKNEKKDIPAASKPVVDDAAPKPDDKNDDGEDKYPLGEFDPNYIRDLTRHTIETESKAIKEREEQERAARELQDQELALVKDWTTKLDAAIETYPDIKDKNADLESTFRDLDPAYGKYLAATIMSMEFGPDVLYYLGNNVEEAKKIVASGAARATVALGRLEAKFADAANQKQAAKPRVSKAPTPPPANKGSAAAAAEAPDDTEDLDAFAKKFFKKRKA